MHVLAALASQLRAHGGTIHQGHRVIGVSRRGAPKVRLADGSTLPADQVVLATGTPILDRGLYFAKLEPQRSYGLAFASAAAPDGMFLSAGGDTRSVRDAPAADGERVLLVGGSGHTVGRSRSELEHVDALRTWTAEYFPGAVGLTSGRLRTTARTTTSRTSVPCRGAVAAFMWRPGSRSGG